LNGSFNLHYLDLQRVFSVEEFYERACKLLGREDGQSHLDLEEAIEGKRVVFCLDEFEQAYKENFGSEFFNALRSLAQTGNLALVVATQEQLGDLHRLFLQDEDVTSKFHNIFARLELGELTPEEARELIATPRNGHQFSHDEINRILKLAGNHPYWLNYVCAEAYAAKQAGAIDFNEIKRKLDEERGATQSAQMANAPETPPAPIRPAPGARDPNAPLRLALILTLIALPIISFSANASFVPGMFVAFALLAVSLLLLLSTTFSWRGGTR
jgi:hypothetical protein